MDHKKTDDPSHIAGANKRWVDEQGPQKNGLGDVGTGDRYGH